ncbi:hypothetical protein NNJEOMEG_03292 [Fundidesulfovibrio magnetotacticus]|uniref:Uncharacterized protein n=1 Tax=Fundidesulfovibrio magnetotacticus TaxID=2730080 RepID=A0A6V8LZI7_9BACT|nr:hypothetical protein [Fundidesulfovibrio magnetotacticus]GFK95429.1 hypothetical protein NNJEOMEG_03292 [Fundidesulfovibrio magnetotacticus]
MKTINTDENSNKAHNKQKCQHNNLTKERMPPYYWDTGDKVCLDCGEVFSPEELTKMRNNTD